MDDFLSEVQNETKKIVVEVTENLRKKMRHSVT